MFCRPHNTSVSTIEWSFWRFVAICCPPGSDRKVTVGLKNNAHGRQYPPSSRSLYHSHWYVESHLCWQLRLFDALGNLYVSSGTKCSLIRRYLPLSLMGSRWQLTKTPTSEWQILGCLAGGSREGWRFRTSGWRFQTGSWRFRREGRRFQKFQGRGWGTTCITKLRLSVNCGILR
jgi:hypothetical protein